MDDRYLDRIPILEKVFKPAAPINKREFFAGRVEEIDKVVDAVKGTGAHVIIYGERGVGKTSLANIIVEIVPGIYAVKVTCTSYDKYEDIWEKALRKIKMRGEQRKIGFTDNIEIVEYTAREIIPEGEALKPEQIGELLGELLSSGTIIFDEFDRIEDKKVKRLIADTIKFISDNIGDITLVLVGVARTVDELIGEHGSIERNLKQIKLERMKQEELTEIIDKGLKELDMAIDEKVREEIVRFSQGFPHYTHLLSKYSARNALENFRLDIRDEDLDSAVQFSLKDVDESIRNTYMKATVATKPTKFPEVILACASADLDEYGTFAAKDVVKPLSEIQGRKAGTASFTYHLGKLIKKDRGPMLEKLGSGKRCRYRFVNPLMIPFVILKGSEKRRI